MVKLRLSVWNSLRCLCEKFNPNKNIIITLIIVILVVSVLSVTIARRAVGNSSSFVQSAVNDTIGIVDKVITAPVRWIETGANSVKKLLSRMKKTNV